MSVGTGENKRGANLTSDGGDLTNDERASHTEMPLQKTEAEVEIGLGGRKKAPGRLEKGAVAIVTKYPKFEQRGSIPKNKRECGDCEGDFKRTPQKSNTAAVQGHPLRITDQTE